MEQIYESTRSGKIIPKEKIVRCKDCVHRGNAKKCIVAFVAKEQDFPVSLIDNHGYWFCADGKPKEST